MTVFRKDKAVAWAPGHVTGFFSSSGSAEDRLERGSIGAGLSLREGMTTTIVKSAGLTVYMNARPLVNAPVTMEVLRLFSEETGLAADSLTIRHRTALPTGSGLGTSGAGALSLSLALNSFFNKPLPALRCLQLAHLAEISCRTGLGTVLADTAGGMEIRTKAGAPGRGTLHSFSAGQYTAVLAVMGPLSTSDQLANTQTMKIAQAEAGSLVEKLLRDPDPELYLLLADGFSRRLNLYSDRLNQAISSLRSAGLVCPMLLFGEGFYTLCPETQKQKTLMQFRKAVQPWPGTRVFLSPLAAHGARLVKA